MLTPRKISWIGWDDGRMYDGCGCRPVGSGLISPASLHLRYWFARFWLVGVTTDLVNTEESIREKNPCQMKIHRGNWGQPSPSGPCRSQSLSIRVVPLSGQWKWMETGLDCPCRNRSSFIFVFCSTFREQMVRPILPALVWRGLDADLGRSYPRG